MWSLVTVLGPILFIGVVVYVTLRSKAAGRANDQRGERGARELREEIDRDPEYRE
jgi:hypothetical protein